MKNIPFTDPEVEKLLSFIGYGDLSAPIWFLGMEEAGGGEENLRYRLSFVQQGLCGGFAPHQYLTVIESITLLLLDSANAPSYT